MSPTHYEDACDLPICRSEILLEELATAQERARHPDNNAEQVKLFAADLKRVERRIASAKIASGIPLAHAARGGATCARCVARLARYPQLFNRARAYRSLEVTP